MVAGAGFGPVTLCYYFGMSRNSRTEVTLDRKCPCGRKKSYRNCCKKNGVTWSIDGTGKLYQGVPMNSDLRGMLEEQQALWKRTFRRKPRKNEFVFLHKYL